MKWISWLKFARSCNIYVLLFSIVHSGLCIGINDCWLMQILSVGWFQTFRLLIELFFTYVDFHINSGIISVGWLCACQIYVWWHYLCWLIKVEAVVSPLTNDVSSSAEQNKTCVFHNRFYGGKFSWRLLWHISRCSNDHVWPCYPATIFQRYLNLLTSTISVFGVCWFEMQFDRISWALCLLLPNIYSFLSHIFSGGFERQESKLYASKTESKVHAHKINQFGFYR